MDGSVSSKRVTGGGGGGGGGGALLATVTVTGAEGVLLPAASRAIAVILCEPSLAVAVFHETEYGAVVASALPLIPSSSRNCTPTTPTLSEALAVTVTVADTVWPLPGEVMLTVGGVVSAAAGVVALAGLDCAERLPAASKAATA